MCCLLIPILTGLICALLGYLLGRLLGKGNHSSAELNAEIEKNKKLRAELEACRSKSKSQGPSYIFDATAAKTAFGVTVKQDDLKIVEGIGPKIEGLFKNSGITTWQELSQLSIEKCREILDSGGDQFLAHDPETWPKQCEMACKNQWSELKKWQDELYGGRV
ncbi:MAG: hypothetical protein ACK5MD_07505 [Flavobacteriales bacterium]